MVRFVLSEFENHWNVSRHDTMVTQVAAGVPTEEEALRIVRPIAESERPSNIIRIDRFGKSKILFEFTE